MADVASDRPCADAGPNSPHSPQHTPGPWEISFEAPRWIIQADGVIGKKAIAYLVGDYVKCEADARLIAAAPELLEALQSLTDALRHLGVDTINPQHPLFFAAWKASQAAIAKATQ